MLGILAALSAELVSSGMVSSSVAIISLGSCGEIISIYIQMLFRSRHNQAMFMRNVLLSRHKFLHLLPVVA